MGQFKNSFSAFSQNAGASMHAPTLKAMEYLSSFDKCTAANRKYVEELLLKADEQAYGMLKGFRENVAKAPKEEWHIYVEDVQYLPVTIALVFDYLDGEDFLSFGKTQSLIGYRLNEALRNGLISLHEKKSVDTAKTARNLRKAFKNAPTEDFMEIWTRIADSYCFPL